MTLQDCEIRVRLRADQGSAELALASYLSSKDTLYPPKDMVMIALMGYWLPLAQKHKSGVVDDECINSSIYRLKLHLEYLEKMLQNKITREDVKESKLEKGSKPLDKSEKWDNPLG